MPMGGWKNSRSPQKNLHNGQKAYVGTYIAVLHNLILCTLAATYLHNIN